MKTLSQKQEIINRIKQAYKLPTDAALATFLGVSKSTISNWASRNSIDYDLIFSKCEHLNFDWLLTGVGCMTQEEQSVIIKQDYSVSIPIVEIGAAAGVSGYDNPDYLEVVDKIEMPYKLIKRNAKYFCIRIKGESMSPTMLDSGYLIVRALDRSEWENIIDNHVYVVSDKEGGAYLKRLKNRLRNHGFIVCISDNPDKISYPNFNIYEEEIHTILRAEWYFTSKMPNIHETYYKKVEDLEDKYDLLQGQMNDMRKTLKTLR